MKKLLILFSFIACLIMTACSNNDEPKLELSAEYLEATTWDAELSGSGYPYHTPITAHFVMQFHSQKTGKCIPAYDDDSYDGSFTYGINKEMITFNGAIIGNWTLKEHSKSKMVLQSFQPNEFTLVLTKI